MPTWMPLPELVARIADRSVVLVEALSADFFAAGHLPGAVNLPLSSRDAPVAAVAEADAATIVVYGSRNGGEATELARRLEVLGATDVRIYAGGKESWVEAGHALERSRARD